MGQPMNLVISGSSMYITTWCTRWDTHNYSVTVETFLNKSDRDTFLAAIRPGAVGELMKILSRPIYYDKSWTGADTIKIIPVAGTNLGDMRSEKTMYVKNYSDTVMSPDYLSVKFEGYISGATL